MPEIFNILTSSVKCQENSAMCRYMDGFLTLRNLMRRLIAADRTGNWEAHLQTVQNLLPIFRECDSLNYLRYGSWYLEKMGMLQKEYPDVLQHFNNGQFVVQTSPGANSPDMRLEQTIQRSKISPGGIIGQTQKEAYISEWELVYQETLAISKVKMWY